MNIDLDKIKTPGDLIQELGLQGFVDNDVSAEKIITDTWNHVKNTWKEVKDTSFTDHGLNHSLRIIGFFVDFDALFKWSPKSKLVFTISALIHDIGMQYKYWLTTDLETIEKNGEKAFPDIHSCSDINIRKSHCELGFKLINEQIINPKNYYMWNFCEDENYKDILYQAMYIGFSHSSSSPYLNEFVENSRDWDGAKDKVKRYSPYLLAGMLRLCDELDCGSERIINPRLNASEIDEYGFSQWLTCYYIQRALVQCSENGDFDPYIDLQWQIPNECLQSDIRMIRNFILKNRSLKINGEIDKVKQFLFSVKEEEGGKISKLTLRYLNDSPRINANLNISQPKKSIMLKYTNLGNADEKIIENPFARKQLSSNLQSEVEIIKSKLEKWFYKTIDPRHYELETTDHTDIFLNCRTLVSDQTLMREIAQFLDNYFNESNLHIDTVLAVGTSAIPIAVNYQVFSNCQSTFTISKKKCIGGEKFSEDYLVTEITPLISKKSKSVLIIDDIISIGDVTKNIIDEYIIKTNVEQIYHFSLFRLGSRKIIENELINEYLWFCHFPWVYYWREGEEGKCIYCEAREPLIPEHRL